MVRKAGVQAPAQRRSGVNRAQLKALAAQQAMAGVAASRPARPITEGDDQEHTGIDLGAVATTRRRAFLSQEQEYKYIRADLIRLGIVSAVLLVVLVVTLFLLPLVS